MARVRKPPNLKSIAGTNQPCREVESINLPLTDGIPPAPDWLPNAHAVKEWDRLVPILHGVGLLTEGGLSALGTLCALHGKLVKLWIADECPTGHMLAQYRNMVNDFGLTPVAQGKVRTSGKSEGKNRFKQFGKRA